MSKRKSAREEMLEKQKERFSNQSNQKEEINIYEELIRGESSDITYINLERLVPSPDEWNFYPQISEKKMIEMILSIMENGLFNPIIVWEKGDKFQILSGHNRVIAYQRIINEYSNTKGFDVSKYEKIPAIVYKEKEIDEEKAREIIIDTNYIQREEDKSLMPTIIKHRLEILRSRTDIKGRTVDILAKELGVSSTKVYEDHVIATKIIPELNDMFFTDQIRKKSLLKFAWFSKSIQKDIYNKYRNELTDDRIVKLRKGMKSEEIDECFTGTFPTKTLVSTSVPEELVDEFRLMVKNWLNENLEKINNEIK